MRDGDKATDNNCETEPTHGQRGAGGIGLEDDYVSGNRGHVGHARAMLEEINLKAGGRQRSRGASKGPLGVDMCSGLISFGKGKLIKYARYYGAYVLVCVSVAFLW